MGTLTQGQALVDIMNATGYDYVIPGNHELNYGMPQFNHLVGSANATYLSCNFTDKRPEVPTLMFAPYAIQDYPLADGSTARVAFVGGLPRRHRWPFAPGICAGQARRRG